jgi:hypothetical protein
MTLDWKTGYRYYMSFLYVIQLSSVELPTSLNLVSLKLFSNYSGTGSDMLMYFINLFFFTVVILEFCLYFELTANIMKVDWLKTPCGRWHVSKYMIIEKYSIGNKL